MRWRNRFGWRKNGADIGDEIESHLQLAIQDRVDRGQSPRDARRAALLEFGSVRLVKEDTQAVSGWTALGQLVDDIRTDLRHSARLLVKSPGFAVTAIVALALGIGANVAIFSVVNTVLLRPVPYPDPDRLVVFATIFQEGPNYTNSEMKYNLWRRQTSVVQNVSGHRYGIVNVTGGDAPEQIQAAWVTADYFRLFGMRVARGRAFTAGEARPNGGQVVVLSDALWKRAFGGAPGIVGKTIALSDSPYEIIGIVAPGVEALVPQPIDAWMPLSIDPNSNNQVHYFTTEGRLQPGVTLAMANAQLQLAADEFRRMYPNAVAMGPQVTFGVREMRDALVSDVRSSLWVLVGAVAFVLLIACANVANLLLVRAASRRREMAIRVAVGAGRGRIVRQVLTESALLSASGGLLGLMLGTMGIHAMLAGNPGNIPRIGEHGSDVTVDWRVLTFTAFVSLTTSILFGLVPALRSARADIRSTLNESSARSGTGTRHHKAGSLLVISEMALALILLIGAALLIRSFIALRSVDPGIDTHQVLTMRMSLSGPRFEKTSAVEQLIRDGARRINALPGVVAAGYSSYVPLEGGAIFPYIIAGRPLNGPYHGFGPWTSISPGYFDVFRIPLLRGRFFTEQDNGDAAPVVIINQAMARRSWPDGDPLNDRLSIGKGAGPEFEEPPRQIVGIVGDVHDGPLSRNPQPTMYVPAAQLTDGLNARIVRGAMAWVVRTRVEPHALGAAVQNELRQASGGLPVASIRSMDDIVDRSTARADFNMWLLTVFGLSALLLAALGIYGLMAYSVRQRTQEIGIRLALGAEPSRVRKMVAVQGMRLAALGIAIGIVSSFGLTRMIASFLFGVKAWDPLVFVATPMVLSIVALLAAWLPALRASRVDPIDALRYE
jgi:putative ABC transport system permease protein